MAKINKLTAYSSSLNNSSWLLSSQRSPFRSGLYLFCILFAQCVTQISAFTSTMLAKSLIGLIHLYRYCLSSLCACSCRFEPTCSVYAIQAIKSRGVLEGLWLGIKRLLRCHPWCAGGLDPVPSTEKKKSC